jgi:hypothetical protein
MVFLEPAFGSNDSSWMNLNCRGIENGLKAISLTDYISKWYGGTFSLNKPSTWMRSSIGLFGKVWYKIFIPLCSERYYPG